MAERKSELERKKAKLAAIREEKKRKEEERLRGEMASSGKIPVVTDLRQETESILKNLGISPTSEELPSEFPSGSSKVSSQSLNSSDGLKDVKAQASPRKPRKLQVCQVNQTNIPPKENVAYSKETQTKDPEPEEKENILDRTKDYYVLSYDEPSKETTVDANAAIAELHKMPHVTLVPPSKTADDDKEEQKKVRELTEEEKNRILMSDDFVRFFAKTAKIMERAINEEPMDIFKDYSGGDTVTGNDVQTNQMLSLHREFYDERWSRYRVVTCLDWSPTFPELLAASYTSNEDAPHDPDGVCLVWNMKFKKTSPEFIFHCQSPVMSTCFAKFQPNLLIGGTYSGQIVIWDNRVNKRAPVQRTILSATSHTHPVYSVTVAGTQNANNLISVSSDGRVCAWTLDMMAQPLESLDLHYKQTRMVTSTCFSFFNDDVNNFVVGSEEGPAYTGSRHGNKTGIMESYESHQGPITGIDTHSTAGPIDFSQIFITSSFDWTIKLWSVEDPKPIYSFEDNGDYVYDVAWSPLHPALFASVDGNGFLDIWNINSSSEIPMSHLLVDNQYALNKCRWHSSGLHIATGDGAGRIKLFDLNEQMATPRHEEWSQFAHTISEFKTNALYQREDDKISYNSIGTKQS